MATRLARVLLLAALLDIQAAGQVLLNASFEEPDPPDAEASDRAAHWGRWGAWINRETGWTPTHSGRCLIGYHHWRIESTDSSGIYQDVVEAPAGEECIFSVFARRDRDTNAKAVTICLEPYGGGQPLASEEYDMERLSGDRWQKLTVKAVNPAQGLRVLLVVKPTGGHLRQGAIKFDDAALAFGEDTDAVQDSLPAD